LQNFSGIVDEPANDLRPGQRRKRAAGEGHKEDRTQQERAGELGLSGANKQYKVMI